jgi:hypothetical protein
MKKYKFKIIVSLLAVTFACFGGYILNDFINSPKETDGADLNHIVYTPGEQNNIDELTAETIVKGVNAESEIISASVNLSCEITVDETYFDLEIFKKTQVLKFYGTALYTVNLKTLSRHDVHIGEDFIKIYIEKPVLFALNLDTEKTIIERAERGLLRFGGIKIAPEDYKEIQLAAISKMTAQLDGDDIKVLTEETAKKAAEELFQSVLSVISEKHFNVEFDFK